MCAYVRAMTNQLKILAAQLNPVVGDISGNLELARGALATGKAKGVDLVVLPELFILGYPAEDLVLKPSAVENSMAAIRELALETQDAPGVIIGSPWAAGGKVHNSALLLADGEICGRHDKRELPNYGVFDEKRLFDAGEGVPEIHVFRGWRLGLAICEDIWFARVPQALARAGAELLIALNASPWRRSIREERQRAFSQWQQDLELPYLFVNQVGGQDELVFDGSSFGVNASGEITLFGSNFETGLYDVSFRREYGWVSETEAILSAGWDAEYRAAVLALGDYVDKNRFPGVVIGLSGGIDSALTAAMAVDALGPERVWCVMMPSQYTSQASLEDARACADMLGVRYETIPISPGVAAMHEMLGPLFNDAPPDTTEENIQSRLRAVTLMALSNRFGHMVVTTGNKSEMAVGYATLYGDMCGGYNALKDFYKTEVFTLSNWRNAHLPRGALGPDGPVMPERIITKPPSAELRADQRDDDSLPPYEVLDDILRGLVDMEEDLDDIVARGHDAKLVRRVEHLLYVAEYKRRQAPPGVKVGGKNFGRDRRYPITNRFRDD